MPIRQERSVLIISESEHWVPGDTLWPIDNSNGHFYRLDRINPDKTIDLWVYALDGHDQKYPGQSRLIEKQKVNALNGRPYLTKDFWKSAHFNEKY